MKARFKANEAKRRGKPRNPRLRFFNELLEDRWQPQVDVAETPDTILIVAELAGVSPENVHVDVAGRELRLHGKRTPPAPDADTFPAEIPEGSFDRSVTLPADVNTAAMRVVLRDGMLRVELPKLAGA